MTLWSTLILLTTLLLCVSVTGRVVRGGGDEAGGGGGGGGGVGDATGGGVTSRCRNSNPPPLVEAASTGSPCLHYFSQRHGVLLTPNFPGPFTVPFSCSWIINATGYEPDSFITLYLTQMYMTRGVHVSQLPFPSLLLPLFCISFLAVLFPLPAMLMKRLLSSPTLFEDLL